ncbi:MAG: NAD(P)H-hydrate dehydratase [Ruminococcus sp.]|nr:NAD(P)H-hydrate dehydratase [Ruminococcus sp.]
MKIITKGQMIQAEQGSVLHGVSLSQLMDNAGFSLFTAIKNYAYKNMISDCLLIVGSGNNGGDGLVCANLLLSAGITPTILLVSDVKTELAKNALSSLNPEIEVLSCENADFEKIIQSAKIIVDCVFGTGFHGELRDDVRQVFASVEASDAYKIACDLPSGVNCENGFAASGTVKFDKTVTFHAAKLGCLISPAREICGEIEAFDICIPPAADLSLPIKEMNDDLAKEFLPKRPDNAHKGTFGKACLLVGSNKYIGAAILSATACLRSGVGLVNVMSVESVVNAIAPSIPEAIFTPLVGTDGVIAKENAELILKEAEKADALLIGCGIQKTPETVELVKRVVEGYKGTIILDADGINSICENIDVLRSTEANVILTPHPAELSRLIGQSTAETLENRIASVISFCDKYGVTMISKSRESFVYSSNEAYLVSKGNSALSKGGSGDMLAGICTSLIAQGVEPPKALALSSYILGECAESLSKDKSKRGIIARDILNALPGVFFNIEN